MPTPNPVGRVHFDEPRAVMVREPENLDSHHSAIHCGVNIYTDHKRQADYIMSQWPELMEKLSLEIETLIDNIPEPEAQVV